MTTAISYIAALAYQLRRIRALVDQATAIHGYPSRATLQSLAVVTADLDAIEGDVGRMVDDMMAARYVRHNALRKAS